MKPQNSKGKGKISRVIRQVSVLMKGKEKCRRKGKEEEGIETAKRSIAGKNGGEGKKVGERAEASWC